VHSSFRPFSAHSPAKKALDIQIFLFTVEIRFEQFQSPGYSIRFSGAQRIINTLEIISQCFDDNKPDS
jgi:hypothetical protein